MTTTAPDKRLAIALTAAVASVTLAVGITAASLLGWFAPRASVTRSTPAQTAEPVPPAVPANPPIIFVPITPATPSTPAAIPTSPSGDVTFAMSDAPGAPHEDDEHEHRHERKHTHEHADHEDDDD